MPGSLNARDKMAHPRLESSEAAPGFTSNPPIVASALMRSVMSTARRMAASEAPVLITGESGVGKELVARAVHQYSGRHEGPFVDINCAALPEHLLESELFGYERGAFSGAEARKPGLFEVARRGTIFLDEIGELDIRVQAKLLRVLDGQPWFRLGGTRKCTLDSRIVAATNLELDHSVDAGRFRRDLFHRLNVLHIRVPALRERIDDIEPLCAGFLRPAMLGISAAALAALQAYSWPGNVRELKNVLLRAALFVRGDRVEVDDLPAELLAGRRKAGTEAGAGAASGAEYSLEDLEEQTIRRALQSTGGHRQRAAEILGISRRTLIRKLKQYRGNAGLSAAGTLRAC